MNLWLFNSVLPSETVGALFWEYSGNSHCKLVKALHKIFHAAVRARVREEVQWWNHQLYSQ